MSNFESSYYLLFPASFEPGMVMLTPDAETSKRPFLTYPLLPGKPLRFSNGFNDRLSYPGEERIDDMLFGGRTFGVRDRVREMIEGFAIEDLQFYPMIFTDALGREHTDYWYMNLYGERPFLDLNTTQLVSASEPGEDVDVMKYAFDNKAMARVPEESRLIFQLEGVWNANFFVHDRILGLLRQGNVTGYRAFRVSDFTEGMQY